MGMNQTAAAEWMAAAMEMMQRAAGDGPEAFRRAALVVAGAWTTESVQQGPDVPEEESPDGSSDNVAELAGAVVDRFKPAVPVEKVAEMITARRGGMSYQDLGEMAGVSTNAARRWMLSVSVDKEASTV